MNKDVTSLTACILDRPRHKKIIDELKDLKVNLKLINDGDVLGALYVSNPNGVTRKDQRAVVDSVNALNGIHNEQDNDPEISARIAQYELAFKMQASVPGLMDVSNEPQHVLDMYGAKPGDGSFASNCLLARRLAEKGVRFIQLYHRGWDHHGGLVQYMNTCCGLTDKPTWALLTDLKQRGMLDETLVVFLTDFGRTPKINGNGGRDHHPGVYSVALAGGGIPGGQVYGSSDSRGAEPGSDACSPADFHATIYAALGIDHKAELHDQQGRPFKICDGEPLPIL